MPLTPLDVAYINKLMDRHLKNQRSWPRIRYFSLAMSALLMVSGMWEMFSAYSFATHLFDGVAPASRPAHVASTAPVTYEALRTAQETTEIKLKMEAWTPTLALYMNVMGVFIFYIGASLTGWTLARWNRHRRDTILITLLREKFADDLSPSIPPSPASPA